MRVVDVAFVDTELKDRKQVLKALRDRLLMAPSRMEVVGMSRTRVDRKAL